MCKQNIFSLFLFLLLSMTSFSQTQPPIEPGVSHELAIWRAKHYSDVRYKLILTLEKMSPILKGEIEIKLSVASASADASKQQIILDWRKPKGTEASYSIKDVSLNESPAEFEEINEHLVIKNAKQGENIVKLKFTSPISTSGSAITRYIDKEDGSEYIYSLFVPSDASTAFPVFDQPDLKARFQLGLNLPKTWKLVSNSVESLSVTRDCGQQVLFDRETGKIIKALPSTGCADIVFFEETKPISTYVFAFAAGNFEVVGDRVAEIEHGLDETNMVDDPDNKEKIKPKPFFTPKIYVRRSQAEKFKQHSAEVFRLNRECIKYLEDYFDYKFPFPKYDLVLIPEFPFGGMEHAGATFLRESSIIFPSEPTKNDIISRANLIFHEAAHQWFGDTVTMKWFDDLWLKEGFAEFMAYKTLEKVIPEANAWKAFYERNKQLAYLTDSTKGTTPIYQEIANLSSAKSAYGNIVYRKAPSFLRQAEFYLGEKEFQTAVRSFLKKNEFKNATWQDLVGEFVEINLTKTKSEEYYQKLTEGDKTEMRKFVDWQIQKEWAKFWIEKRGMAIYRSSPRLFDNDWDLSWALNLAAIGAHTRLYDAFSQEGTLKEKGENYNWLQDIKVIKAFDNGEKEIETGIIGYRKYAYLPDAENQRIEDIKNGKRNEYKFEKEETNESRNQYEEERKRKEARKTLFVFPNYQDYGYGIFLLDEKSRNYILANVQNEKDDFLRSMMYGSLWDSVREAELDPKEFVELAIKNVGTEKDEMIVSAILSRVNTALNYYIKSEPSALAGGSKSSSNNVKVIPSAHADGSNLVAKLETVLFNKMQTAETTSQKITFYRAFLNVANSETARNLLKDFLKPKAKIQSPFTLKTKDKFDIVTKLLVLGDKDAENLLAELVKTETSDDAKRYAYAAKAGIATAENKAKYFNDFVANKEISESWIESAFVPFNSTKHSELTLQFLEKALAELPNLKRNRKIFFVNGWLSAFISGQKSEQALGIVNKFLADNPNLDKDLRLKVLENVDLIERAVKIRGNFGK
jgi:hypothetical protein